VDRQEYPGPPGQRPRAPHGEAEEDETLRAEQEGHVKDTLGRIAKDGVRQLHGVLCAVEVRPPEGRNGVGAQAVVGEQQADAQDAKDYRDQRPAFPADLRQVDRQGEDAEGQEGEPRM
jgi:hypothetical protein